MSLFIDFETRSKANLKKVGAFNYALDPSTEILCLRWAFLNDTPEEVGIWTPECSRLPTELFRAIENGVDVHAHNAFFEHCIWNLTARRRYAWHTPLRRKNLFCTMAQAEALALPRTLGGLGEALNTDVKKDTEGHRIMLQLSKPRKPSKTDQRVWFNDFEKYEKLFEYCADDVLSERSAWLEMRPLSESERKVWLLDQEINTRGVYCDVELCKTAMGFLDKFAGDLTIELQRITDGKIETGKQLKKMGAFLGSRGLKVKDLTADTVRELLASDLSDPVARRVLEIRQLLGKSSTSKFKSMVSFANDNDGRIRGMLRYHGASTGRFSGKGVQPQNFPRGNVKELKPLFEALEMGDYEFFKDLYPNVADALSSTLRGMLRAAPGHELIAADFSSIEARVLFWVADAFDGVKVFERGEDIYIEMASAIYGVPPEQVTKAQRQLGKQAILGLGYGMGFRKFAETCKGYGMDVTPEFSKRVVDLYRSKYVAVKTFWYAQDAAAKEAVRRGKAVKAGKIIWQVKGKYLFCRLPSGRLLSYYKPRLVTEKTAYGDRESLAFMGMNSMTNKFGTQYTYGGKLVENIVQAIARDLLVYSMFKVEEAGYPIVFHVHDEIVSEVKKGTGSVEELETLMSDTPDWAEGCPVEAEGWRAERFKK